LSRKNEGSLSIIFNDIQFQEFQKYAQHIKVRLHFVCLIFPLFLGLSWWYSLGMYKLCWWLVFSLWFWGEDFFCILHVRTD